MEIHWKNRAASAQSRGPAKPVFESSMPALPTTVPAPRSVLPLGPVFLDNEYIPSLGMSVCLRYSKFGERRIAAFAVWSFRNIAPKRKNYRPGRGSQLPRDCRGRRISVSGDCSIFFRRREGAPKATPSPPLQVINASVRWHSKRAGREAKVANLTCKHGISDATFYNGKPSVAAWRCRRRSGGERPKRHQCPHSFSLADVSLRKLADGAGITPNTSSTHWETSSRAQSPPGFPMIWRPLGKPSLSSPEGTEIAG
jgi:hypothetical protein